MRINLYLLEYFTQYYISCVHPHNMLFRLRNNKSISNGISLGRIAAESIVRSMAGIA